MSYSGCVVLRYINRAGVDWRVDVTWEIRRRLRFNFSDAVQNSGHYAWERFNVLQGVDQCWLDVRDWHGEARYFRGKGA